MGGKREKGKGETIGEKGKKGKGGAAHELLISRKWKNGGG